MKKTILILLMTAMSTVHAQQNKIEPTVSVTGKGVVRVVPDEVSIRVRVEHTGKSAIEVKRQNDEVIDQVLKFCRQMKIDKKDVVTERINLNKNYDYQKKEYNYAANQALNIHLKDLEKYEALLQGLLDSGINRIDGIQFLSSEMEKHQAEARIRAVKNAKEKAVAYAGVLGQGVGKAITISENSAVSYPRPQYAELKATADFRGPSETIAIGEMSVSATVNIVFELN
ncbi:DUF541 domain-containing protein [Leptobacterium flavescens]|uniref:DUF541 domain-containing protein n=1 Tax=Leptobacterium flavescens TaxID=472055 RepID=A0A6P0USR4_9FLAO|nr:SIMPL domain-containing protein [Leptobacterium flavescens]NER13406.1 DUF541 domain-containing protein [Leptobacterium flavescens]